MRTNVKGKSKTSAPSFPAISQIILKEIILVSDHIGIDQQDMQITTNSTMIFNTIAASDDQFTSCQSEPSAERYGLISNR